jgi:hypothetical protein
MDVQAIDQEYTQLQTQAQQTIGALGALAEKLRTAAQSGNQDAREWMLDLKEIALAMQAEQNQVAALLQALHGFVANQMPQAAAPPSPWTGAPAQPWGGQPQAPGYPPPGPYSQQPQAGNMGGMLGGFLNSGFGRAIEMGAGFGIGDDIISGIFRAL